MNASAIIALIDMLENRFAVNARRHPGIHWADVAVRLEKNPDRCHVLAEMERTGGEPDVLVLEGEISFVDCSPESPVGRRSLCYDRTALDARKENKPAGSALEMAASLGIDLLTESQYRALQELGEFDRKTSSWILTPAPVRALSGVRHESLAGVSRLQLLGLHLLELLHCARIQR